MVFKTLHQTEQVRSSVTFFVAGHACHELFVHFYFYFYFFCIQGKLSCPPLKYADLSTSPPSNVLHVFSSVALVDQTRPVTGFSSMGRPYRYETSSSVIVTSPASKWNVLVLGLQFSIRALINAWSILAFLRSARWWSPVLRMYSLIFRVNFQHEDFRSAGINRKHSISFRRQWTGVSCKENGLFFLNRSLNHSVLSKDGIHLTQHQLRRYMIGFVI